MKTINDRWPPSPSPKALDKTHHLNNPKDHAVIAPDNTTDFARQPDTPDVQTAPFSQRHSGMDSKEATVRMSVPPLGDGAGHRLAGIAATTALVLETNNLRGGSDAVQALGSLKRLVARYAQQSV